MTSKIGNTPLSAHFLIFGRDGAFFFLRIAFATAQTMRHSKNATIKCKNTTPTNENICVER